MLYAQLKDWPDGYEEVEYLAKMLKRYDHTYAVHVETKMFALRDGASADYVIAIIRWEGSNAGNLRRTLLVTTDDIAEATGMLRLLIGNAKDDRSMNMYV
jgi:hypothetical protein